MPALEFSSAEPACSGADLAVLLELLALENVQVGAAAQTSACSRAFVVRPFAPPARGDVRLTLVVRLPQEFPRMLDRPEWRGRLERGSCPLCVHNCVQTLGALTQPLKPYRLSGPTA